jgi:putative hemolysin
VCFFEDNRQCEEWALFRGQCPVGGVKVTGYENDAQVFCAITGGQVQGVGTDSVLCKRTDGTLCSIQANFNGECPDPNNPTPNAGNGEAQ